MGFWLPSRSRPKVVTRSDILCNLQHCDCLRIGRAKLLLQVQWRTRDPDGAPVTECSVEAGLAEQPVTSLYQLRASLRCCSVA